MCEAMLLFVLLLLAGTTVFVDKDGGDNVATDNKKRR
jgi:hypothetical protein